MKQYQYILLDWDGNLAKTLEIWLEVSRQLLLEYGHQLTKNNIGLNFTEPLEFYQSLGLPDPAGVIMQRQEIVLQRLPEAELYPDAMEVLTYLKAANKHLALVTSSPQLGVLPALNRLGLSSIFETVVTGDDVTNYKPHPEPLELALSRLGGNKKAAIMIGDTDADIISANRCGIDSIAFMPPEHEEFYNFDSILKHQPTHAVTDFRKIMDLIY